MGKMSYPRILIQVPLVNVSRLRGLTHNVSQYFVASRAPQTEASSSVWVCCACNARPVVAARAKCGHLFCHVCSIRQRSVSTPFLLISIRTIRINNKSSSRLVQVPGLRRRDGSGPAELSGMTKIYLKIKFGMDHESCGHGVKIAGAQRQKIAMTSRMFLTLLLAGGRRRGRELPDILEDSHGRLITELGNFRDLK